MAQMVDSKQRELNTFEIVHTAIEDAGDTSTPMQAQLAGIMAELSHKGSEVKQFGNTLFVAHPAPDRKALVRAFNADTATNFVQNMQDFGTFAYQDLGIDTIFIPGMGDPDLARLLQAAFARPARPDMGYQLVNNPQGRATVAMAQLGPSRS